MAKEVSTSRVVKFGVLEVDLHKGEVRKNGLKLRLRGQPFQVLSILLEHPGDVVTREEFQRRLWTDDDTFVDFEHGLNAVVNRLREVLGDSPESPHFIETVPRHGYRWMVPTEDLEDQSTRESPRRAHVWLLWTAALLAGIGLAVGVLRFVPSSPTSSAPALTSVPLTARPGHESEPSFSPDGNQVAFTRTEESEDKPHIYVKQIGTDGPPLQLTSGPGADGDSVWSPDGRFIAFLRDLPQARTEVLLIPALGGPERKIAEIRLPSLPAPYLAWSPDGNSLVLSHKDSPNEPAALFVVAIDSGEKRRLTFPPSPTISDASGDTNPAFSPDGRTLAFIRMVDLHPKLYLLPISDTVKPAGAAKEKPLGSLGGTEGFLQGFTPVWTEDGRQIVLSRWRQGLWRVGISGSGARFEEPQQLPFGENACCPAISRRGHLLAYSNAVFHFGIWRMAASAGPRAADGATVGRLSRSFISSTQSDLAPQFSPDGRRIAFVSARSGNFEIWACNRDGSSPRQVTSLHGPVVSTPRWSPDGRRISFDSDAEGAFDVWVIRADGGKPVRMTTHPGNDGNPSWSHDGRWIYFDSARTGEQQLWKMPAEGGEAIQLTRDGGWAPLESPDGKFLYYTKYLVDTSVWRVALDGGQTAAKVLDGLSNYINVALVDKGIYFVPIQAGASGSSVQFLDLQTNKITRIANFERPAGDGLALSPDGQWILYSQIDKSSAELRLVENFH